jgi:nucleolar protein 56
MNENTDGDTGWFAGVARGDLDAARTAIETGTAESPEDWPSEAIEAGFADDEGDYYEALHEATVHATREAVREREMADDQQLKHSIRAMDDAERVANELAERVAEWAGSRREDAGTGVGYARRLVDEADEESESDRLVGLARRAVDLADEAEALRGHVERTAPGVAPNLSALAGPVLAARLIALAGGLETLARKPSGTVQVLGAEDALFAHLRGEGPSPKHGVIYVHDAVHNTRPEDRGSAARALAGKLAIAARADHYTGKRRPELDRQLEERIDRIRARTDDSDGDATPNGGEAP